jgi:hypothetical protein
MIFVAKRNAQMGKYPFPALYLTAQETCLAQPLRMAAMAEFSMD